MSKVNLEKINNFTTKEVLPLPIYGTRKLISNDADSWGALIHKQLLGRERKIELERFSQQ